MRQAGTLKTTVLTKILNSNGNKFPLLGTPDDTLNIFGEIMNKLINCNLSTK